MKHITKYLGLAVATCLLAGGAFAASYIEADYTTWDSASVPSGGSAVGTITLDGSGASGGEVNIISLGDGGATDAIFADTGSILLGGNQDLTAYTPLNGQHVLNATFDFFSDSGGGNPSPAYLGLYFLSGTTYWRYTLYTSLDLDLGSGWTGFDVGMSQTAGWSTYGTGSLGFEAALASVDQIGIQVGYTGELNQDYGIDNFALHYPEPGTYAVLAFALMSLGVTFRGKLQNGLKGLLHK